MSELELETAVTELSPEALERFAAWFAEYRAEQWDRRIEADAQRGALDELVREAQADVAAGRVRPLP